METQQDFLETRGAVSRIRDHDCQMVRLDREGPKAEQLVMQT